MEHEKLCLIFPFQRLVPTEGGMKGGEKFCIKNKELGLHTSYDDGTFSLPSKLKV